LHTHTHSLFLSLFCMTNVIEFESRASDKSSDRPTFEGPDIAWPAVPSSSHSTLCTSLP
jgi:hypothetical protein